VALWGGTWLKLSSLAEDYELASVGTAIMTFVIGLTLIADGIAEALYRPSEPVNDDINAMEEKR
jgi:hypothetical protein